MRRYLHKQIFKDTEKSKCYVLVLVARAGGQGGTGKGKFSGFINLEIELCRYSI